jgi:hypothetical protein
VEELAVADGRWTMDGTWLTMARLRHAALCLGSWARQYPNSERHPLEPIRNTLCGLAGSLRVGLCCSLVADCRGYARVTRASRMGEWAQRGRTQPADQDHD